MCRDHDKLKTVTNASADNWYRMSKKTETLARLGNFFIVKSYERDSLFLREPV